jgi:hypothetical protein
MPAANTKVTPYRADFLNRNHVRAFVNFVVSLCDSEEFTHQYLNRDQGTHWKCYSLRNAYEQYAWKGATFEQTVRLLAAWASALRVSLLAADSAIGQINVEVLDVCKSIQVWGGTGRGRNGGGNIAALALLNSQDRGIVGHLERTRNAIVAFANDGKC